MADNQRSRLVTEGVQRAPNRAMLRAVGFGDADFVKPIVGLANGHSNITPCNAGLGRLAAARARPGCARPAPCPRPSAPSRSATRISMGTEGMKYSLVSREVIADSIETVCNGEAMDGLLAVGGCDKNMPGAMMAIARLDIPSIFIYGGTIKPGHLDGRDLTIVSVFEAVGELSAGKIDAGASCSPSRRPPAPAPGSCGGMFTANTMSSAIEALGLSLPYSSTMASEDDDKAQSAEESGRVLAQAAAPRPHRAQDPHPARRSRTRSRW